MKSSKIKRLRAAGWKIGSTKDLLRLSDEEAQLIETRIALANGVRNLRQSTGITQSELARRLGSSQSRIAKVEAADPRVSIDLLVRCLFALGATRQQVARIVGSKRPAA